jgi:2,3-bisphosphoglycerate-independent phosphoglycerate mutase
MSGASARRGPVVLALIDGLGEGDLAEALAGALAGVGPVARGRLVAAGEALGLAGSRPGDGRAGYEAIGTGRVPRDVRARIASICAENALFVADPVARVLELADDQRGRTTTDFFTGIERPTCSVHAIALLSDAAPHAAREALMATIDELAYRELPFVVHAIVDGRDAPPRTAWRHVEMLSELVEGKGTIGTIAGSRYALAARGDWEPTLALYRAIVLGDDVERAATPYDALASAYDRGLDDDAIEPVRIGSYEGMNGGLSAELPADEPAWRWLGEDVGLVLDPLGFGFTRLLRALTRTDVPDEVGTALTLRGRPMIAFPPGRLATLAPAPGALGLPSIVAASDPRTESLTECVIAAKLRLLRVAEPSREAHLAAHFDGVDAPRAGTMIELASDDGDAVDRVANAVAEGEADVIVVALGGVDAALHAGDHAAAARVVDEVAPRLAAIARWLAPLGGALVVTSSHAGSEQLVPDSNEARGHTAGRVPILVVGAGREALVEGTLLDVAPTVLALAGAVPPVSWPGRSLAAAQAARG